MAWHRAVLISEIAKRERAGLAQSHEGVGVVVELALSGLVIVAGGVELWDVTGVHGVPIAGLEVHTKCVRIGASGANGSQVELHTAILGHNESVCYTHSSQGFLVGA